MRKALIFFLVILFHKSFLMFFKISYKFYLKKQKVGKAIEWKWVGRFCNDFSKHAPHPSSTLRLNSPFSTTRAATAADSLVCPEHADVFKHKWDRCTPHMVGQESSLVHTLFCNLFFSLFSFFNINSHIYLVFRAVNHCICAPSWTYTATSLTGRKAPSWCLCVCFVITVVESSKDPPVHTTLQIDVSLWLK